MKILNFASWNHTVFKFLQELLSYTLYVGAEYNATRRQLRALLAPPLTRQYRAARLVRTHDVSF